MTRPDKGRGVVIVDRCVYINKMLGIISDRQKFDEIKESIHSYSTRIEDKINNFLRKLKKLKLLSDETYKSLFVSGSGPGILYGLPKIHKPNFCTEFPFRPIFAAYNTASYKLAKFFVPILAPLTTNQFTVVNSHSFVDSLRDVTDVENLYMSSFDVSNLFTNVPLDETINICLDSLYTTGTNAIIGLPRNLFKQFLELSVKNSFFIFNSKLYKQIDGVGMGLPLGPSFANIFMCHHEREWLENCPVAFRPVFYKRYVDDTFVLFKHKNHVPLFLNYINSQHRNIKFTYETENNNSISFLDVKVERSNDGFVTSVYRKPTFSGQGTSYFSFCSFLFKVNAIKTLIYRAFKISSNYFKMNEEFDFLLRYFRNNGYPSFLIHSHIKNFLNKVLGDNESSIDSTLQIPVQTKYFCFQYFGPQSEKLKIELQTLFTKFFPTLNIKLIFTNKFTISSFFRFKDSLPPMSRSSVVYKYGCPLCGDQYVGSTSRTLFVRASEHGGRSHRTGALLTCPPHSAIRVHCEQACLSPVSYDNFKILAAAPDLVSLRILESLHIFKSKPKLNDSDSSFPLNIVH